MKLPFLIATVLVGLLTFLTAPMTWAQTNATADIQTHPKVNLYNPSRLYQRPVLNFFEDLGFRFGSVFSSRYVWNGVAESVGPVWQPSASVEYKGFGASVQGNFVLNDEPNQGQFNEVDFTGYWGSKFSKLEIDLAFTYSIFPNDNPASLNFSPDQLEGNLHVAYPVGPIDLFTDFSVWLYNPLGGFFWDFGIGYRHNLPLNFSLSSAILFGLGNGLYNQTEVGVTAGINANLFNYSLSFNWSPAKGLILSPEFNVSTLLTSQLRAGVPYPTNVWGDLTVSYNF